MGDDTEIIQPTEADTNLMAQLMAISSDYLRGNSSDSAVAIFAHFLGRLSYRHNGGKHSGESVRLMLINMAEGWKFMEHADAEMRKKQ